ncbi:hypothetical protein [Streptomyces sp. URMC 129]|uniref:hypothetical protein n=1 Tax=Streptomyces sp. URMC 129 TaxID=3423407 RepID=UPI003F1B0854
MASILVVELVEQVRGVLAIASSSMASGTRYGASGKNSGIALPGVRLRFQTSTDSSRP